MSKISRANDHIPCESLLLNAIKEENIILTTQLLLETKNLEELNEISTIAFSYLAKSGNLELAKILLNHGFKLNQQHNLATKTPPHIACEYGNLNFLKFLVNTCNLKLNVKDNLLMTPLHWAVEYAHYDIVDYILKEHLDDIDFASVDKFNRTVHELALITRNQRIINLIEEKIKIKRSNSASSSTNFFNKTQFNIKSFAKSFPKAQSPQNTKRAFSNFEETIEDDDDIFKLSPAGSLSSSPNSQQMNETLNWLENQVYTQTNTNLNKSEQNTLNNLSSIDLLDHIKNGRELVLTEAGKQLLLLTDETESTKNLLEKLAKSYENKKNVDITNNIETILDEEIINDDDDDDDDSDELNMTNVVKRCRFSNSPKSTPNQFDIDLDSFLDNFLNSR